MDVADLHQDGSAEDELNAQIAASQWFSRGWTLQELLAPKRITFFNSEWRPIGDKQTLSSVLNNRTAIPKSVLQGVRTSQECSIAQRMSWASSRTTTQPEDIAYCMLGLFDVNMDLRYGEGGVKAFLRLQEEVIKQSDDHSIFAWNMHRDEDQHGLLADHPIAFKDCEHIVSIETPYGRAPYSITNRGMALELPAIPYTVDTYLVQLSCLDARYLDHYHNLEENSVLLDEKSPHKESQEPESDNRLARSVRAD